MKRALPITALIAVLAIAGGMVLSATPSAKEGPDVNVIQSVSGSDGAGAPRAQGAAPIIETWRLTAESPGNYRHPAVAEDSKGNRLAIFRSTGGTSYDFVYCPKGGTWSTPTSINGGVQPALVRSLYAWLRVDSTDRFHAYWEYANAAVYASFKDGVWTTPFKVSYVGSYDQTSGIDLRSNDEVVTVDCEVIGYSKDVWIHVKGKDESTFRSPFNLTRDPGEGSTQPSIAIDSKNRSWVVWKSDLHIPNVEENLVIYLAWFYPDNRDGDDDWFLVSPNPGWSFLPQVAVNNEDKVMTLFACSTYGQYLSRMYNPNTKQMGSLTLLNIGLTMNPWHTFFSRLAAHGKDFYAAVMTPGRILKLMKFDETKSEWTEYCQVSDLPVEMFHLFSGYDRMLIAYSTWDEPTSVYLTAVEVEPLLPKQYALTVQSGSGGTTNPAPGTYNYDRDSNVIITAFPDTAFRLKNWTGDASGTANPLTVTMDKDRTVKANFEYVLQPAVGVTAQKKLERSFFRGYYMNVVTWQENPLNVAQKVTIVEQRLYRKTRAADNSQWALLASLGPSTMTYTDMNVGKDSDYVYSVGLVDDKGNVSGYY